MKEIPVRLLWKTLSWKRVFNACAAISSYLVSAVTRKRFIRGRPFILTVEPTNICNLECPLCVTGNGSLTRSAGLMDFNTFKTVIDDVGDYIFYLLLYHQGEPFINKNFLKFVRYAKNKRIFVTTSTNAHYLGPEAARETVASGLDSIIVSIDGITQETFETYRVNGDLERAKSGLRNLVAEKRKRRKRTPFINVQFIVMRQNEHEITEMKNWVTESGADNFLCKTVQVETVNEAKEWLPSEGFSRYQISADKLKLKRTGSGPCYRPWTSTLINWDGTVVPCCFDKNGKYNFGAVGRSGHQMKKIWESTEYDDFRQKMLRERDTIEMCSNCSQGIRLFT